MKTNKIDLYISKLIEDLSNGLTWLASDNVGFGSIQEKYGANDIQIKAIMKHPKLEGLEPTINVFQVIDDTKEEVKEVVSESKPTVVDTTEFFNL